MNTSGTVPIDSVDKKVTQKNELLYFSYYLISNHVFIIVNSSGYKLLLLYKTTTKNQILNTILI